VSDTFSVVLVHGRAAAFEIPSSQSRQWADALRFALLRVESRFANRIVPSYASYGDLWREDRRAAPPVFITPGGTRVTVSGDPPAVHEAPVGPQPAGVGALTALADAILPDAALGGVLRLALPDVFEYLEDRAIREEADARLIDACRASDAAVLVGFSMGSIVGYHVLQSAPPDFPVRAFITIGSPLGLGPVNRPLRKLTPGDRTPFPPHLRMWLNIWNADDVATGVHGRALADLFPDPDGGRTIQEAENAGRHAAATNVFGAHDALDYLSSLAMGTALHAALLDAEAGV
jgi:hypothetical protein